MNDAMRTPGLSKNEVFRNPKKPRIPSMVALSRDSRDRIMGTMPAEELRIDLDQALNCIDALQDEIAALRALERAEPISDERVARIMEAASEPKEVDKLNPFQGTYRGKQDELERMKRRYEENVEFQNTRAQKLQDKYDEILARNSELARRIMEMQSERERVATQRVSAADEQKIQEMVNARVATARSKRKPGSDT